MNWSFVRSVLGAFGFHQRWIDWIMTCCSTVSMNVMLNGSVFQSFRPARGLRQGDPLSPYIFILCMKVLSRITNKRVDAGYIKGFKLAWGVLPLNHLLFVDDVFLFGKATRREASQFKECLDTFCLWSGQSFNSHKSNIFFSKNTNRDLEGSISDIIQFERIPILSHYLGLPLFHSNKINDFSYIVDKLDSKLVDSRIQQFWWGTRLADMNRAFLAKWSWRLISNVSSLCLSILRGKYLHNNSFLNVTVAPTDSIFWKNVVKIKPLILRGACIMVGDGSIIDLWLHPWVPSHLTFRPVPICPRDLGALVVADPFHPNGGWDVPKLRAIFSNANLQVANRLVWTPLTSGKFSIKYVYWLDQIGRFERSCRWPEKFWKRVWSASTLLRHKLLWWLCLQDALPSRDCLARLFSIPDLSCPLCGLALESLTRLFVCCPCASHLWMASQWGISDSALALGTSSHGLPSELLPCWEKPCSNSYHNASFSVIKTLTSGDDPSSSAMIRVWSHTTTTENLLPHTTSTSYPDA
ncbi:hypothetical protein UlMin_000234 [Ulmus minor]